MDACITPYLIVPRSRLGQAVRRLNRMAQMVCVSILLLGAAPGSAVAQGGSGSFELEVRTIRASDVGENTPGSGVIDPRLEDLRSQLEQLHYRTFKLLAAERERVLTRKKTIFSLIDGHRFAVKPLYLDGNRVGVWMRWVDGDGAEVLDTRMHLTCGESIIAGTDRESGEGMIVAVRPSVLGGPIE